MKKKIEFGLLVAVIGLFILTAAVPRVGGMILKITALPIAIAYLINVIFFKRRRGKPKS